MSSMNFWVSYVNIYFSYNLKPSIPQSKEEILVFVQTLLDFAHQSSSIYNVNIAEFMSFKKNSVGGNHHGYINAQGNFYSLYKVHVSKGSFFNAIL